MKKDLIGALEGSEMKRPVAQYLADDTLQDEKVKEMEKNDFLDFKKVEKKTKRFNLLLKPSTYKGLVKASKKYGVNVTEMINMVADGFLRKEEEENEKR